MAGHKLGKLCISDIRNKTTIYIVSWYTTQDPTVHNALDYYESGPSKLGIVTLEMVSCPSGIPC